MIISVRIDAAMHLIIRALAIGILMLVSFAVNAQECIRPPLTSEDTSTFAFGAAVNAILRHIGANIEAEAKRQETSILANSSNPDKMIIDLILLYETCTAIQADKTLTVDQRLEALLRVNNALRPARTVTRQAHAKHGGVHTVHFPGPKTLYGRFEECSGTNTCGPEFYAEKAAEMCDKSGYKRATAFVSGKMPGSLKTICSN